MLQIMKLGKREAEMDTNQRTIKTQSINVVAPAPLRVTEISN